jgi:hypothetical protein
MKLRNVRQAAVALCLCLSAGATDRVFAEPLPSAQPADIMSSIYKEAIRTDSSGWLDPPERPKHLSKSLVDLWACADAKKPPDGDEGPIDFDLTADTNGLQLTSFKVSTAHADESRATVAVRLGYQEPYVHPPKPSVVVYEFVREDGRWAIDDIHTDRWSVRDLLSHWLRDG